MGPTKLRLVTLWSELCGPTLRKQRVGDKIAGQTKFVDKMENTYHFTEKSIFIFSPNATVSTNFTTFIYHRSISSRLEKILISKCIDGFACLPPGIPPRTCPITYITYQTVLPESGDINLTFAIYMPEYPYSEVT